MLSRVFWANATWTAVIALGLIIITGGRAQGDQITSIVAFGDSLSDMGNDSIASGGTQPAPTADYYQGLFTNGPNWLGYLAHDLGVATPTASLAGGTDYATYPNRATLGTEIGTQPGEHLSDRVTEIEGFFAEIAAGEPGFSGEVAVRLDRDPFQAQGHERLQEVLTAAMERVLGHPPKVTGMNAWTDAALMQAAGIPTLLIGATGGNYHAPGEWVSVSELVKLCAILEQAVAAFLA